MFLLLAAVLLATIWLAFKVYMRHAEQCASKMPGPRGLPILGMAVQVLRLKSVEDMMFAIKDLSQEFRKEGLFKAWFGPFLFVFLNSPKHIEILAASQNASFKGPIYNFMFGEVVDGVFATDDEKKWKELKKPLNKLMTQKLLNTDQHMVFLKRTRQLVEHIREHKQGQEINIVKYLQNSFIDILAETHLGVELHELKNPMYNFVESVNRILEFVCPQGIWNYVYKVLNIEIKLPEDVQKNKIKIHQFYEWIFEERRKKRQTQRQGMEDGVEYYTDFLQRRKEEKQLPWKDIYRELSDVSVAGSDTAAIALSSTLIFLAMHPEIQEQAYQEQISLLGSDPQLEPTFSQLSSMVLLTMIIKESLRLSSIAILYRQAKGDVELNGYIIPKGTVIGVSVEDVHSNPQYWEKPESFYPNHFLPEKEAARPKHAFIPFGFGIRKCPGSRYGMAVMKMVLSCVLRNFKLTTSQKYEDSIFEYKLLRELKCGYNIAFTDRHNIS